MNMKRRIMAFSLILSIVLLMWSSPVLAGVTCHTIDATGMGQDLGGGITQAQIQDGGLLQGTTIGEFTFTNLPSLDFEGTVTFTTNRATLEVTVAGTIVILDASTAAFNASGPITDATGKLEGANGNLTFDGIQNLVDGSFTETVTGQFCADLSP